MNDQLTIIALDLLSRPVSQEEANKILSMIADARAQCESNAMQVALVLAEREDLSDDDVERLEGIYDKANENLDLLKNVAAMYSDGPFFEINSN